MVEGRCGMRFLHALRQHILLHPPRKHICPLQVHLELILRAVLCTQSQGTGREGPCASYELARVALWPIAYGPNGYVSAADPWSLLALHGLLRVMPDYLAQLLHVLPVHPILSSSTCSACLCLAGQSRIIQPNAPRCLHAHSFVPVFCGIHGPWNKRHHVVCGFVCTCSSLCASRTSTRTHTQSHTLARTLTHTTRTPAH